MRRPPPAMPPPGLHRVPSMQDWYLSVPSHQRMPPPYPCCKGHPAATPSILSAIWEKPLFWHPHTCRRDISPKSVCKKEVSSRRPLPSWAFPPRHRRHPWVPTGNGWQRQTTALPPQNIRRQRQRAAKSVFPSAILDFSTFWASLPLGFVPFSFTPYKDACCFWKPSPSNLRQTAAPVMFFQMVFSRFFAAKEDILLSQTPFFWPFLLIYHIKKERIWILSFFVAFKTLIHRYP